AATARREAVCLGTGPPAADGARRGEHPTNPRPLVIVNPAAGGGRARGFWQRCAAACASVGVAVEVVQTAGRGDAADYAAAAGDRLVIAVGGDGTGAEVVARAARGPAALGGTMNFLAAAVVSLLRHRNTPVRLRLDDGPVLQRRVRTIAVANGAYLGGAMRIAPQARVDDGWFEVVTIGDVGRWLGIRSLPMLYRGTHGQLVQVEFGRARRVEIVSDVPIGIEADGELAGTTPAVFEVIPGALQVIDWRPSGILSGDSAGPAGPRE